ncbi:hypothetical protein EVA_15971 [gut metagenome]|uniref:Uncharacterized protein n=1 Tax=gut metagenome TaxID=749906 RepID=J9FN89_9ZZZZ
MVLLRVLIPIVGEVLSVFEFNTVAALTSIEVCDAILTRLLDNLHTLEHDEVALVLTILDLVPVGGREVVVEVAEVVDDRDVVHIGLALDVVGLEGNRCCSQSSHGLCRSTHSSWQATAS